MKQHHNVKTSVLLFPLHLTGRKKGNLPLKLCMVSDNRKSSSGSLWYKHVVKLTPIAYCNSVRMQFWVSRDLSTDLTAWKATVRNVVTFGRYSNIKPYLQKYFRTKPPVEFVHWLKANWIVNGIYIKYYIIVCYLLGQAIKSYFAPKEPAANTINPILRLLCMLRHIRKCPCELFNGN